tara:strand:- start:5124 stop:5282 length:159 start_codon:yes stop_codon:yes gene_type:complete
MSNSSSANKENRYGWVPFAESWNGRMAMLGLFVGLLTELLTGQSVISQLGLG